ncbi:MAG: FAD-dependent oxidoreductase, partial [Archaeoglobi archaeon]|nr:FAD-dependent oxidoreductase [Archaeoglobi archaeon]
MNEYDAIVIGTGSAMIIAGRLLSENPEARVAVVDKDDAGGICLTRGCIPSKLVISPAEVLYDLEKMRDFIDAEVRGVNFGRIMRRMREKVDRESRMIEESLRRSENIDYFKDVAEFVDRYTLKVGGTEIKSDRIFIGSGSRPLVPGIKGLREAGYLTSDTILRLEEMPESMVIIGGGYIAVEYGNFFARAGCDVRIVEMMPR